ncbi:sensor histidine kinase [Desulfurispira natronophila]|uniref:histidine kinase n=1 Tax=Desulfurispira natronophila TaxID=682562 RepID=A0A7W8DGX2_9BACT|nr:HAMP domain-containing sensor histidine kinase [Desulfurispira natronophila]MBB5021797.1 signal transduction histidine kinase [Desulfurispira natronophila]
MEYSLFVFGTIAMVFAGIIFCLHYSHRHSCWLPLSFASALLATALWLALASQLFPHSWILPIRDGGLFLSAVAIMIAGLRSIPMPIPTWKLGAGTLLLGLLLAWISSPTTMVIVTWVAFAIPGALLCAQSLWRQTASSQSTLLIALRVLALSLLLMVILLPWGLGTALPISFQPVSMLLVRIIAMALLALAAFGAWLILLKSLHSAPQDEPQKVYSLSSGTSAVVVCSLLVFTWYGVQWFSKHEEELQLQHLERQINILSETLNTDRIAQMSFSPEETGTVLYRRVTNMLGSYRNVQPQTSRILLYRPQSDGFALGPVSGEYSATDHRIHYPRHPGAATAAFSENKLQVVQQLAQGNPIVAIYLPAQTTSGDRIAYGIEMISHQEQMVRHLKTAMAIPLFSAMAFTLLVVTLNNVLFLRTMPRMRSLCCVRHIEVIFVFFTGLLFTALVAGSSHLFERQNRNFLFEHWSNHKTDQIKNSMFHLHDSLQLLEHYLTHANDLSPAAFKALAEPMAHNLGLAGIAWARMEDNTSTPSAPLTLYAGEELPLAQLDSDILADERLAPFAQQAKRSGIPFMAAPFATDNDDSNPQWTAIILHVERKDFAYQGFLVAFMHIENFWSQAISNDNNADILVDVRLQGGGESHSYTLYEPSLKSTIHHFTKLESTYPLFRYGYAWVFTTRPGPLFELAYPNRAAAIIVGAGLILTLGASFFAWYLVGTNRRIQETVEQRTAELQRNRDFQQLLLRELPVGVAVHNPNTLQLEHQNRAWEEMFQDSSQGSDVWQRLQWAISSACHHCQTVDIPDDQYPLTNGEVRHLHTFITPIPGEDTDTQNVLICSQDITTRKNAEHALQDVLQKQQQEIDRAVQTVREQDHQIFEQMRRHALLSLLVNLAHHWRQPLNVVALAVQELEELFCDGELTKEECHKRVETALDEVLKLSETITQFTNLYETPEDQRDNYQLHKLCNQAFRLIVSLPNIQLELDNQVDEHLNIRVNRNDIIELLVEFFRNVQEAMQQRDITQATVYVSAQRLEEDQVEIVVEDHVGGIDAAIIQDIFEPYVTTAFRARDKGLGLYISRRIVEDRYRGTIEAMNREQGAAFRVVLSGC